MADNLVVGVVSTRTGDHAPIGTYCEAGAQLAAEEINGRGGISVPGGGPARALALVHADDGGTPEGAGRAIAFLLAERDPFAVLGPDLSALTYPTIHLTRQAEVLQFTSALSSRLTRLGNPWLFRVRPHNGYRAAAAARTIAQRKYARLAIVYLDNELGQDGRSQAETALAAAGAVPLCALPVRGPAEDNRPLIAEVLRARPDAVLYWGTQPAGAAVLWALRAAGWGGTFLSNTMDDIFLDLAGDAAEGSLGFDCFSYSDPDPGIQDFRRRFRARWRKEPDAHAVATYDALMLLADAVGRVGPRRAAVRDLLCAGEAFAGVAHAYRFDAQGELRGWATVYEIRDGAAVFLARIEEPLAGC
ncbi:MAG TPA: ABC transporter substrate-binding protein [Candidatus Sulfotelmatobacter sp.]|nr:ABC transporter substrate-binding protein [Candidatus Sulfotelmatobacter sp.]